MIRVTTVGTSLRCIMMQKLVFSVVLFALKSFWYIFSVVSGIQLALQGINLASFVNLLWGMQRKPVFPSPSSCTHFVLRNMLSKSLDDLWIGRVPNGSCEALSGGHVRVDHIYILVSDIGWLPSFPSHNEHLSSFHRPCNRMAACPAYISVIAIDEAA